MNDVYESIMAGLHEAVEDAKSKKQQENTKESETEPETKHTFV